MDGAHSTAYIAYMNALLKGYSNNSCKRTLRGVK